MKSYFYIISLLVVLASCESVIDVDIPHEPPKLVVNTLINPDSVIQVRISQSQYILDESNFKKVNNATVSIFEEGVLKEQLTKTQEDGVYISQFKPQIGKSYTLTAEAPNFTSIEATTFLDPKVPIEEIALDSTIEVNGSFCVDDSCITYYQVYYKVGLTLQDPGNEPNYYSTVAYVKRHYIYETQNPDGSYRIDTLEYIEQLYLFSNDVSVALAEFDLDGGGYWGEEILFSDETFDGQTYTFDFEIESGFDSHNKAEEIIFVLKHLSEAQYEYQISKELQNWNDGNPFAEPVPVYNNIKNGFGIFAGYSADTKVEKP